MFTDVGSGVIPPARNWQAGRVGQRGGEGGDPSKGNDVLLFRSPCWFDYQGNQQLGQRAIMWTVTNEVLSLRGLDIHVREAGSGQAGDVQKARK